MMAAISKHRRRMKRAIARERETSQEINYHEILITTLTTAIAITAATVISSLVLKSLSKPPSQVVVVPGAPAPPASVVTPAGGAPEA